MLGMSRPRILLFVLLMLASTVFSQLYIRYRIAQREEVFTTLNMAGRQRTKSLMLVKEAHRLLNAPMGEQAAIRQELATTATDFEQAHQHLLHHHPAPVQASYARMAPKADSLLVAFQQFLAASPEQASQALAHLEDLQTEFLSAMEGAVTATEKYGHGNMNVIARVEMWVSAGSFLSLLLALGYVLVPLIRNIEEKNRSLTEKNNALAKSEDELRKSFEQMIHLHETIEYHWERQKVFIEQAPGAIAMFDLDMVYLVASRSWYEDYGLEDQEIIGRSHYEVFPEIGEEWKEIHRHCLSGGTHHTDASPLQRADGTVQWLSWDIKPWHNMEGEIGGIIMYTDNITAYTTLRQEQDRLVEILEKASEAARIGAWELDLTNLNLYWSNTVKAIHGLSQDYQPDLNTGLNFIAPGWPRKAAQAAINRAIRIGKPFDRELKITTAEGEERWIRALGDPQMNNGTCVRLFGLVQDITPLKAQELKISNLLAELDAILNSTTEVSIISSDLHGTITHFSGGAEKLLGYRAQEMIGKRTPEIIHLPEEVAARSREVSEDLGMPVEGFEVFVAYARQGKPNTKVWTYVRKDGSQFKVQLSVTAMRNAAGSIIGFVGVATDLTEINRLREEAMEKNRSLHTLTERLTKQNLQLANFAHITSHNLRAPVSNLNSLLGFYKESNDPADRTQLMEKFETVIHHLSSTLDSLVQALIIREDAHDDLEHLHFHEIFEKTRQTVVAQISEAGANFSVDFSEAPSLTYKRDFLESIFLNLLTNAIKYRSQERPLHIRITSGKSTQGAITLSFADNGSGIDLKKHGAKLFGLNKTFHQNQDAKGVGLFITKTQIESLGGKIATESQVNEGTTFHITF